MLLCPRATCMLVTVEEFPSGPRPLASDVVVVVVEDGVCRKRRERGGASSQPTPCQEQ